MPAENGGQSAETPKRQRVTLGMDTVEGPRVWVSIHPLLDNLISAAAQEVEYAKTSADRLDAQIVVDKAKALKVALERWDDA